MPWQYQGRARRPSKAKAQAERETVKGHFRYEVLPRRQDPWAPGVEQSWAGAGAAASSPLRTAARLTLLSGVCRQLYVETALLPQKLNAWSFETAHLMERYILKENRMPLSQRRALRVLYCRERLHKDVQKKLKWLKVIIWKDGETLRWQDLELFPDVAWKDRKELIERSWRW